MAGILRLCAVKHCSDKLRWIAQSALDVKGNPSVVLLMNDDIRKQIVELAEIQIFA